MSDDFLPDTTPTRDADDHLTLPVTDRWNTPLGKPNGGWVLASLIRASSMGFDVGRPAVAAITYFASPEPGTTALIETSAVKLGRRVQTVRASMAAGGRPLAEATTNFVRDHHGLTQQLGSAPDLPDPRSLPDPRTLGLPSEGLFGQIEYRIATIPGWATGQHSGDPTIELWQRLDDGQPIDWPALGLLCDAAPPAVLELATVASMTVQLTVHLHRLPRPDTWVGTRITTRHVVDGFHEEDVELWDEDGHLLAQSRQLAIILD